MCLSVCALRVCEEGEGRRWPRRCLGLCGLRTWVLRQAAPSSSSSSSSEEAVDMERRKRWRGVMSDEAARALVWNSMTPRPDRQGLSSNESLGLQLPLLRHHKAHNMGILMRTE